MTYSVLLQATKKQGYNAIVLDFPFLPMLRHLNDLSVLASVLKADPDWFLSDNIEHFGTNLAGATGLNILTSVDFLHRLIVPAP